MEYVTVEKECIALAVLEQNITRKNVAKKRTNLFITLSHYIYSNMDIQTLKNLFPDLEEELYEEILQHGTVRKVKEGETLLRVGQTIRSTILS